MKQEEDKCCGDCCWFCFEDTDGWGFCNTPEMLPEHTDRSFTNCGMPVRENATCGYVSRKEMRHYMAVLLQHNRWRKSCLTPGRIRQVDPFEVGSALDFAYKYMKVFSKL